MAIYDYNKRNWEEDVSSAQARKRAAEEAVNGYGSFSYGRQADYDAARDAVINRGAFKYDLDKDALYKQLAENYKNLGKLAMKDTMGQASAMTGGYGNSYAQTAGQQAYQQFMQKSNEMIPQFYQMARENYDAEGNELRAKLGILADDRNTAYGEWRDRFSQLVSDRDYAGSEYNNIYNAAFEAARAAKADEQWERQFAATQAARRSSGGSGGGNKQKATDEEKSQKNAQLEYQLANKEPPAGYSAKEILDLGFGAISEERLMQLIRQGEVAVAEDGTLTRVTHDETGFKGQGSFNRDWNMTNTRGIK